MPNARKKKYPIKHWSYSSLISYLRNPIAWYKRYVEGVYDMPGSPAALIGQSGHVALQHFYSGLSKEEAIEIGLVYLRSIPDFEINFGKVSSKKGQKDKRKKMESEYKQAVNFYLERPPRHKVLGAEVKGLSRIPGIPIPVKAISDLVVLSRVDKNAVDIVDHKFVASYGSREIDNPLFMLQALFNYYTVLFTFKKPVRRFIVYECKKTKNRDGRPQLRRHLIDFREHENEFRFFHGLVADATKDLLTRKKFLPNPTDMFDGKESLEIYRQKLID
jgi:hypothetical protein